MTHRRFALMSAAFLRQYCGGMIPPKFAFPTLTKLTARDSCLIQLKAGQPLSDDAEAVMYRDHDQFDQALNSLRNWFRSANALGKTESYRGWIQKTAEAFKVGEPLSRNVLTSMGQDLDTHQRTVEAIEAWKTVAQALGHSNEYCDRIAKLAETCKKGAPVSERVAIAMRQDLNTYEQLQVNAKGVDATQTNNNLQLEIDE